MGSQKNLLEAGSQEGLPDRGNPKSLLETANQKSHLAVKTLGQVARTRGRHASELVTLLPVAQV